jgi:hypothetical protein
MGSVGDSYDNALMENFWSTLKIELVYRTSWRTRDEAENAILDYIDAWYNTRRPASGLAAAGVAYGSAFTCRASSDHRLPVQHDDKILRNTRLVCDSGMTSGRQRSSNGANRVHNGCNPGEFAQLIGVPGAQINATTTIKSPQLCH